MFTIRIRGLNGAIESGTEGSIFWLTFAKIKGPSNLKILEKLSDKQLLKRCQDYGRRSLKWRWKFLGLLPEIERRRLWEKRGFLSVFHFAAQTAGVSRDQVSRVLNMDKRFEANRVFQLRELLVEGEVSPNKLARVVSVADVKTEEAWVAHVKALPHRAVERLVKDVQFQNLDGLRKPKIEIKSVHAHRLDLSAEVEVKLQEMQNRGIDVDEFLMKALVEREMAIEYEKEAIATNLPKEQPRSMTVQVERVINAEWGSKCAVKSCPWIAKEVHHLVPFSINPVHDPRLMAPLCREHHAVAHSVNRCVQGKWREVVEA